ncbi:MAG: GDSL-type esterase/lipase family protein [Elusimicrobiota bacterium]|nr:GDSL-type esterase/lipase family protein [Elusimicrobiota bacterium]
MRRAALAAACLLAVPPALEALARAALAVWLRDPAVLVATPASMGPYSAMRPDLNLDGYLRYAPGSLKRLYTPHPWFGLRPYHTRFNALGFRGPQPVVPKPSGVFRVVCLGESSTLGAFNPDDETFPALLEKALNASAPAGLRFETVNLGVARQTSAALGPLLRRVVLPLDPDLVVFYGGHNDARDALFGPPPEPSGPWLLPQLALMARLRLFARGPAAEAARAADAALAPRFRDALLSTADALSRRGVPFIVATQKHGGASRGERPYAVEYARVAAALARDGSFADGLDAVTYAHHRLMAAVSGYAAGRFVVVDGIAALDAAPRAFVSPIHLTRAGNEALVRALSAPVLESAARRSRPTPPAARRPRPDGTSPAPAR